MKFILFVFIAILTDISLFSQSYTVDLSENYKEGNFYKAAKTIEIRKPEPGTYLEKTFYVNTVNYYEINDLNKFIRILLVNSGYTDVKIKSITKPFAKFSGGNLLSKTGFRLQNVFQINIENNFEVFDLCSVLSKNPEIKYAVPVIAYRLNDSKPDDTSLSAQWALDSINIFKAWDIAKGDKSVVIGIIDSGVDIGHEDLKNQVWTNTAEVPDDGIDNDGNGFIDDVHGWDFIGDISYSDAIQGKYSENGVVVPAFNSNDHGTHVAGICAAQSNNSTGIASTGYNVTFIPVKITLDDLEKSRLVFRPYEAMLYAAANGADVISCSWSSNFHDPLAEDVISELLDNGKIVVAAAGNDGSWIDFSPYYPAAYPGVIAVGSFNKQNGLYYSSNYGIRVTCYSPGESIFSTINNNGYSAKNGTSMAAPIVSGIAATLKNLFSTYSNKQILHQIRSTTKKFDNSIGFMTYGRLNAFDAFRYNNPQFPAYKVPGIAVDDILIEDTNAVIKTGLTKIKLKVKNYLSKADNITIKLSSQNEFAGFSSDSSFTISTLNDNETIDIDIVLNLFENCPWFSGDVAVYITYTAGSYTDAELIKIPIRLETTNKNFLVQIFDEYLDAKWYSSLSTGKFNYWAVGYDNSGKRGLVYNFGSLNGLFSPVKDTLTDISVAETSNVFISANGAENKTYILRSSNGGTTLLSTDVSIFLKTVKGLKFPEKNSGFAFGVNHQDIAEIIYTETGGVSFQKSAYNFTFNAGAKEYINSNLSSKNNVHFLGTSTGRLIKSSDNGKNWETVSQQFAGSIIHVAAVNNDTLTVIMNQAGVYNLYISKNGGKNFSAVDYKLSDLSKTVKLFTADSSNTIYIFSDESKLYYTNDLGNSWQPELNQQYKFGPVSSASLTSESGKNRLWYAGYDINYLDFDFIPANVLFDVRIAGENSLTYDTLDIHKTSEKIVFVENTGNIKAKVLSQIFTNGSVFSLSNQFNKTVSPTELISARIKFSPEFEGTYYDTLLVLTDASTEPLKFYMKGVATDPTSVVNQNNDGKDYILTQTGLNSYSLEILTGNTEKLVISISDINGKNVQNPVKLNTNSLSGKIEFTTETLPNGVYFLNIKGINTFKTIKLFVIN